MCWRVKCRYSSQSNRKRIPRIVLLTLSILLMAVVVGSLSLFVLRGVLHLDFSQDYRQIEGVDQILFQENWHHKMYTRSFWGLRYTGQEGKEKNSLEDVETAENQEAEIKWLDADVYDISKARDYVVWYDAQEDKILSGNIKGEMIGSFDTQYTVEQIALSPDERYILFCEIEYGVNGGYSTDEEYCYYWVIDTKDGAQYTIYSGYREWFELYWE